MVFRAAGLFAANRKIHVCGHTNLANTTSSWASRGEKFLGEKTQYAKERICLYRMCAGPPTTGLPQPSFLYAPGFSHSPGGSVLVVAGCVSVV